MGVSGGMIVVDASVLVDALGGHGSKAKRAREAINATEMLAPSHIDIEALAGWRRQVRAGELSAELADEAVTILGDLPVRRLPHEPLLRRIWQLRDNVTMADAAYVALAEHFRVPLVTSDGRLTRAIGPRCEFQLIS